MTLNDFVQTYNGKYVDFDGAWGAQCMDEMHQFIVEVLGINNASVLAAPCARDVYVNFPSITGHELFDQIANTTNNVPQEGDIMFWGMLPYGHVATFVEGDANTFRSFDQNWPTGSPCHIQGHTYTNVLGWLRCKNTSQQSELDKCINDRNSHYDFLSAIANVLNKPISRDVIIPELQRLVTLEDVIRQKETQLQDAQTKIADLDKQLGELNFQHTQLIDQNEKLTKKVADQQKTIDDQGIQISGLSTSIQNLKDQINKPVLVGWRKWIFDLLYR
jgi:hypothetical protein